MTTARFPFTTMPWPLMATLVAIGLPRTVLSDLDIVTANGSLVYFVLALAPYAAWLVVAIGRPTRRPLRDFVILGVLYGLSLILVHQVLWNAPGSQHSIPQSAIDVAGGFSAPLDEVVLRLYTCGIAMMIGAGSGLAVAIIAVIARLVRNTRRRKAAAVRGRGEDRPRNG